MIHTRSLQVMHHSKSYFAVGKTKTQEGHLYNVTPFGDVSSTREAPSPLSYPKEATFPIGEKLKHDNNYSYLVFLPSMYFQILLVNMNLVNTELSGNNLISHCL